MSLPGSNPTPAEALEWALEATPGAAEEFARAEVEVIERLDPGHAHLCPRAVSGFEHCRCTCDYDAREALRKLAES